MFGRIGKTVVSMVVAGAAIVGISASANAGIIGSANYFYQAGQNFNPGASALDLKLDGGTIFTIANPSAGAPISLATAAPGAFAALVAVLKDGNSNDITTSAFTNAGIPGVVTISDFLYNTPPTTDLSHQGPGLIVDVIMTINRFQSTPIVGLPGAFLAEYDLDIEVDAIPVPGALLSAASGLALMGWMGVRRKRAA